MIAALAKMEPERVAWTSQGLRRVRSFSKMYGRSAWGLRKVGGGGGESLLDLGLFAASGVVRGAALGAGVWYSSSAFKTGDRAGVVGGMAPWQDVEEGKDCDFTLTAAPLLYRSMLRVSKTTEKTPVCTAVDEVMMRRVSRWKRLVWAKYESKEDSCIG